MSLSNYWNNNYAGKGASEQSPFTKELHNKIIQLIPDSSKTILDAGCGTGGLMKKINAIGKYQITGTDLSEEAIQVAKKNTDLNCFVGSITNLEVNDKSFDVVICSEVIEHLFGEDLEKAFSELVRVTKGTIIISTPHLEDLIYHHTKCQSCDTSFHPAGHIRSIDASFFEPFIKKYTSNYSFHYTGKRGPRFRIYGNIIRKLKNYVVWLDNLRCPTCNNNIEKTHMSMFNRILTKIYTIMQKIFLFLGAKKYNNIILEAHIN